MLKLTECNKICLKADTGKMLYNASIDTYTPKAYLFTEAEESDWVEVDASEVPVMDEEATEADYIAELQRLGVAL